MTDIVVIVDLPVSSAEDIDDMELSLLLRDVKAGNIVDYVDASQVEITVRGGGSQEPMQQAYSEPY